MEGTGFTRGGIEALKTELIWNAVKDKRKITVLFNFFELDKCRFITILENEVKYNRYINVISDKNTITIKKQKNKTSIEEMLGLLTEACLDWIQYIKDEEKTRSGEIYLYYNNIEININTNELYGLNNVQLQKESKIFFINIFNQTSMSDDIYNCLTQKNHRLVNLIWSIIRLAEYKSSDSTIHFPHIDSSNLHNNARTENIYNCFLLEKNPSSIQDKIGEIKKFFDLLITTKERKEEYLNELYEHWEKTKHDSRIIEWIDRFINRDKKLSNDDREQVLIWIWNHIKSKYYNNTHPTWVTSGDFKQDNMTLNENIITFFDLMTNDAIKNSIISELKTSASKAKYRISNNNKIHLNIPVSEETKSKFDKLKNNFNLSNEELIERLINLGSEKLQKYGLDN
ncbi:hypothetical protein [uncultured Tolumonas sp.]|uniref:hypothetical protein n=1 Tax=uncultured Tolumonas sp. TaxID=263765 RepID=UPI002A0A93EA|nr:hypothetical protein [uncultured Tolumonas sp.]